jgi:hypothetical protein
MLFDTFLYDHMILSGSLRLFRIMFEARVYPEQSLGTALRFAALSLVTRALPNGGVVTTPAQISGGAFSEIQS